MSSIYRLDRLRGALFDAASRRFDPATRTWNACSDDAGETRALENVDSLAAATWLQRESAFPLRTPIGVLGPREANDAQLSAALAVGELLASCGFAVICGGRQGVMQAVCEGVARNGGLSIGLLPDADPVLANRFVAIPIATGIGEARNALIARASFCLIAIGDSYGTLSEVALGRQFGKVVIGLEGAARVSGVLHVSDARVAVTRVADLALGAGDADAATS